MVSQYHGKEGFCLQLLLILCSTAAYLSRNLMVKEEDEGEDVDENEECGDDDAFFFTLKGGVKPVL